MKELIAQPVVSVCIPMYNASRYIEQALNSILQQTYKRIEIIVVDDHSSDQSLEVAKRYTSLGVKVVVNPKKGACAARNYAFQQSTGQFIKFMDADDLCDIALIERQVSAIVHRSDFTLAFSPLSMLFPDGEVVRPQRSIDRDFQPGIDLQAEIWKFGGFNCPHCYLMHRELAEQAGGWDETLLKNQDAEYYSRVLALADCAVSVATARVIWRQTNVGISSQTNQEAVRSMAESLIKIARVLLSSSSSDDISGICGRYVGLFVFKNYPAIKPVLPRIIDAMRELNVELVLPDRRLLGVLRPIVGWKIAATVMNKYGL